MFHKTTSTILKPTRHILAKMPNRQASSNDMEEFKKSHNTSSALEAIKRDMEADKKELKWRQPFGDRPQDWNSKFKLFSNEKQNSDYLIWTQQPWDLSPAGIKRWWERRKERQERFLQQYMPEREAILGPELAAAHFVLYRGGSVRMVGGKWLRADDMGEFDLPKSYDPNYRVEAMRCDGMTLYYEGLENMRGLQQLKFLSFHNVKTFDDWYLDRVSGSQHPRLEVLDISGTECTPRGLTCLYRVPTLKLLILDDPKKTLEHELYCAILEETLAELKIVKASEVHGIVEQQN